MAALPKPQHATADAIYRWREQHADNGHRPHLGASLIGHACDRYLWLKFRWARAEQFEGRVLRLFDTGKREEPRVHEELRGIGCQVWADDGSAQYRVSALGGHFAGSMDGVIQGLPEAPKTTHVLEIKTHGAKSFAELGKKGVVDSKPMHAAQMQTYMHLAEIGRALYFAVNKDTDEIYTERVPYDEAAAKALVERAERVIRASEPPLKLSEDPAWFGCKWCPFHELCHGQAAPEVNCRTCAHSTPVLEGERGAWHCDKQGKAIGLPEQRRGCDQHRFIPMQLVNFAKPVDMAGDSVVYELVDGGRFMNGDRPGLSSKEIHACQDKVMLGDDRLHEVLAKYPGSTVAA